MEEEQGYDADPEEDENHAAAGPSDDGEAGEVTATMAEIYVSQGLIEQAINIYEKVLMQEPGNEKAKARLEQLRNMEDQETGDT